MASLRDILLGSEDNRVVVTAMIFEGDDLDKDLVDVFPPSLQGTPDNKKELTIMLAEPQIVDELIEVMNKAGSDFYDKWSDAQMQARLEEIPEGASVRY